MRNYRFRRLVMAIAQREIPAGLIHHSDRGRQYCSHVYVERLFDSGACKRHVDPRAANRERVCGKLYQDALCVWKCICISIKPLRRRSRACRRF